MVNRTLLLAALLFAAAFPAHSQSAFVIGDPTLAILSWEPAAQGRYQVLVRREGEIFIDTVAEDNELRLNLSPGSYEYRVTVLNRAGDAVSTREWKALEVATPKIPYFRVMRPLTARIGAADERLNLEIMAPNLPPDTEFFLERDDERVGTELRQDGEMVLVGFSPADLSPGSWDLIARAATGRGFVESEAVLLLPPLREPTFEAVDARILPSSGLAAVNIRGDGFDAGMTVRIEGPGGEIPVAAMRLRNDRNALIFLNLDKARLGSYDLVLVDPAGGETRESRVFEVRAVKRGPLGKAEPHFEFQYGFPLAISVIPAAESGSENRIIPSLLAVEAAFGLQSSSTAPFLRGLGVETRYGISAAGPWEGSGRLKFSEVVDLSVYWRPLVSGNIEPVILLGAGNTWLATDPAKAQNAHVHFRAGAAMDFLSGRQLFRFGINGNFVVVGQTVVPVISLMLRAGLRF